LPRLTLSPGALSSKDPVSSQNCNQFITLPTTFAVPYSPYQSFAEIPFFPPPAQEMQSAPSSNQGQYNQAMQVGFFDQRGRYSSLGPNCPVRLPYGASILPEPVPSGRIVWEGDKVQLVRCMRCDAVHNVFSRCQDYCGAIAAKVPRSQSTAALAS